MFVNARWRELSGLSLEAAYGQGWVTALHPEDRPRVAAEWYAAAQEQREFRCEYRFQSPAGNITWLRGAAAAIRSVDGAVVGYIGTVTDITDRREAEARLEAREAQLRFVTDSAPVYLAHCSRDRRYLFVNKPYAERFRRQPAELVGRTLAEILGDAAYRMIEPYIERVLSGEYVEYEVTIPYRELGKRVMKCSYEPIVESDGGISGWVAVVQDVTAQKEADTALRESERRFSRFMQHLSGLAWIKDGDGRYVYVNDAAQQAFGMPREMLYGKRDDEVFDAATARQFIANDERAKASGSGIQSVESLEDSSGRVRQSLVSKFVIPATDGKAAFVGGMAIDITDRIDADAELRRHKERLELAQRVGRIGTFDWNIQTGEVVWSPIEEELFGLPPGGFGGRLDHWKQAVHPDDRERAVADSVQAVQNRVDLVTEFRIVRPDCQVRWIAAQGRVVDDEAGNPLRMIGVNIDITDQREANEALREADRRKDEFLATLAHELRNPLAPIRNALEILKLPRLDDAMAQETRDIMERQVHHLVRLVDDLLDVSRVMRGKIELRREPVELSNIIARAVEMAQPLIELQRHTLEIIAAEDSLLLDADPIRLAQVVGNLFTNAAKYSESQGRIWVTARREGNQAVLSVRDAGIGIAPGMLTQIFELFVQADHASTKTHGGLGIGLTLVKNLVEMHGGTVTAHSAGLGTGSEFLVRLPLISRTSQTLSPQRDVVAPSEFTGHRLLVVDDNRDAALTLYKWLQLQGHQVQLMHDGPSTLALVRDYQPELIFLDLGMPRMDGYEVARRIRQMENLPQPILVALTGWGQPEDRRRTAEAGFNHHLVKPTEFDAIAKLLEQLRQS